MAQSRHSAGGGISRSPMHQRCMLETRTPSGRAAVTRPVDPKPAAWLDAEFIVGNPPFIAGKDLRAELGDGYAEALWKAYPKVPKSADIALHFW